MDNQKTDDTNNTTTKNNTNDSQEPTGITQDETITEDANTKNTKDNELQLVNILQTKIRNSKQRYIGHKHSRLQRIKLNTVSQRLLSERGKCDTGVSSVQELATKH